jgi:putative DNA primase/helicase
MSNHLIYTQDHTEAFFTRWLIVEFPNSRLVSGEPIDHDLPDRIIKNELSAIAFWALTGGMRLMENGSFSESIVHDRLMEKWRYTTNSLHEFINECCDLSTNEYELRSKFYSEYKEWCGENGRKPFAKGKVKDMLAANIGLGITHTVLDGYEIFRGVKMKKADFCGLNPELRKKY